MTSLDAGVPGTRWSDITDPHGILRALGGLRGRGPRRGWDMLVAVDPDPGMAIWQDTVVEFTELLRRSRVFRRVDRRRLGPLPPGGGSAGRLTLVVTDGNAPAWRSGDRSRTLHRWAGAGPLAVVHLLPHHAWPETGVPTWPMSLRSAGPGAPNRAHGTGPRHLGLGAPDEDGPSLPVPVLEPAPRSLRSWARLVTGARGTRARLPLTFATPRPGPAPPPGPEPRPAERVAAFRRSVTPDVLAVATLLAAVPLAVPVIRHVLARLRPEARIFDFTQLLTHRLVHPRTGPPPAEGPPLAYDFAPGVRGELLAAGRTEELRLVVDLVAEALGESAWGRWQVPALLTGAELFIPLRSGAEARAWAEPQIAVLHAVSGPHAAQARALEQLTAAPQPPDTPACGPSPSYLRKQEDLVNQPTKQPRTDVPSGAAPTTERRGNSSPAVWGHVPPRNPNFTGRVELLDALHRRLRKERATAVLPNALHGMGGVGKSMLAVEYVYRHLPEYDLVWWISAERTAQIALSLVELAHHLGLESGNEASWSVAAVLEALRRGEPYANWLLVFDNADSPEAVRPYFPLGGPGNILVTSRNPQWASVAKPLEVNVFRREESVELLRRRGPDITDDEADRLATALGDLPLALEQAAAWRAETGMPADEYLRLLEEKQVDLLGLAPPLDYQLPVIAAWNVSLDQLETRNPAAMQLLQLCAFCAPESISRNLFSGLPGTSITPELDLVLRDPIRLGQAIREIGRYSLARFDFRANSLQMHRLVQTALIARMTEAEQERMRNGIHLLLAANDPRDPHNATQWPRYGELYPHLVVSEAVGSTDPYVRTLVINEVRYLLRWGNYEAALHLAESAYEAWRQGDGEDDPKTLELSKWMGAVLLSMGRYAESSAVNDRVLEAYRRTVGEDHEDTLDALGNVAIDRRVKGDFAAALELSESVHERYLRQLGEEDPETLRAAHNLGVSLRLAGQFARARRLDARTWHSKQQMYGQDHVVSLVTWLSLILDDRELGDYHAALTHQRDLTDRCGRLLGQVNPFTLSNHRHLAVALRKAGRHEEARETAEQAQDALVARYGANNPGSMASTLELSIDLRHAGELTTARKLGTRIHAQYAETYGRTHPHTLSAEVDLAVTLRHMGEPEAARAIDEQALSAFHRVLGERHPSSLVCATNLASDLYDLGEYAAARELDERTLALSTDVLGADHPSTLACAANLPLDLRALGEHEEAERRHTATAERLNRALGADHPAVRQAVDWETRADCDIDPLPL
ncbi:FxSxx-COOH system tetratricopeptide repeat protein [Streptomyces sp. GXMU-J15]|uniref:FxSxx-COOH system tetratricopeptide repeat protein n=1 Tax=Streptomyces fuscus TaxID=3048495 RepID=A0ABT7ITF5_9ACTN|nr:FxSxx-COOH system tetratricopeptide repeat protein [Streptomyces fuscus]MDL2075870.1 FxSxx-COOH system tetratricopeptide repeat protein [Streptomyces fuscus]